MQFVDVIVGGQYGSEAKGHVTAQIVKQAVRTAKVQGVDAKIINVRVAGPNAGHTAYDKNLNQFAFRSLPVGAVVDPSVLLYIAPGSEIDWPVLVAEVRAAEAAGHIIRDRLYISKQATLLTIEHKIAEEDAGLVGRIGSTGKGIGAARADRIMRSAYTLGQAMTDHDLYTIGASWAEPEDLYASDDIVHDQNTHVVIEGTQGYGLSLRASGHYPHVTSSDARAVDFLAMAGVDPTRCQIKIQNWVVARVFPIRVAGNSGEMQGEHTWDELGLPEERTTVTQKVRRVGEWDVDLLKRAVQANGGHEANVVITMLDQVIPSLTAWQGMTLDDEFEMPVEAGEALTEATDWINEHASREQIGAYVAGLTFSPYDMLFTGHADREPEIDEEAMQAAAQKVIAEMFGAEIIGDNDADAEGSKN